MKFRRFVVLFMIFAMFLSIAPVTAAEESGSTTISASLRAAGGYTITYFYDWEVDESVVPVSPDYLEIGSGETSSAICTANVTKTAQYGESMQFVEGELEITNTGSASTVGLEVSMMIQADIGEGFQDVFAFPVDVPGNPVLEPGETGVYPFVVAFSPWPNAPHRIISNPTILNYEGSEGAPSGDMIRASFTISDMPVILSIDGAATLTEDFDPVSGFEVSSDFVPQTFNESGSYTFNINYTNVSATSDIYLSAGDTLSLVEEDSLNVSYRTVTVPIYTGLEPIVVVSQNSSYWRNNCKSNQDLVLQYLPICLGDPGGKYSTEVKTAKQAASILSKKGSDVDKLKAQLLAAKLNIASGVDSSKVDLTITLADDFLGTSNTAAFHRMTPSSQRVIRDLISRLVWFNGGGR